jgi:6-phosphogluconate dehydrogenase
MIGLGRMGANLARRLMAGGHTVVANDVNPATVDSLAAEGAVAAHSLAEVVQRLPTPRAVWIMVPAALTHGVIAELEQLLSPGDVIIDGGNSYYRDDIDRADLLATKGLHFVDVGTSGGVFGLERGYCLMIGGLPEPVNWLRPIFETLAPGVDAAPRTAGRVGEPTPAEQGWLHCGPPGAGHFVKMVHNGIEYGMMAALGEGLNLLAHAADGDVARQADAETAPLRDSQYYRLPINISEVAEVWRRGSVISSWLVDLTAHALSVDPQLDHFDGHVSDSGEGRWTVNAGVDVGVPLPVLSAALFGRFASRGNDDLANKVLSALRSEFGGHVEQRPADTPVPPPPAAS